MTATLEDIYNILTEIKNEVRDLIALQQISPDQIAISEGLSDISRRLGLVMAGEFRSGNGQDPGKGFSGVRIAYPPLSYDDELWNIVGVESDDLQVGIRASDGKLVAGGGTVFLDRFGVNLLDQLGALYIGVGADQYAISIGSAADGSMQIANDVGAVRLYPNTDTLANSPAFTVIEDTSLSDRLLVQLSRGTLGSRLILIGTGGNAFLDLRAEGESGGQTFIGIHETSTTPGNPASGTFGHIYLKDDKLIIQFNDGGTVRYKYLDLTGTGVTWVHTTSAP